MPQVSEVNAVVATLFNPLESSGPTPICKIYSSLATAAALPSEKSLLRAGATGHLTQPMLEPVSFSSLGGYRLGGYPSLSSCKHTYRQMKYLICFSKSLARTA